MKRALLFAVLGTMSQLYAQQLPGTEIYLVDLSLKKSRVSVSNPKNITNNKGYDNQPYFNPEKPVLYYASAGPDERTDIRAYDYEIQKVRNITNTQEREYSPTVTPDREFLSCIIQRDSITQNLGKYPIEGGEAITFITTLTIGYHAWINQTELLLFVLGDTMTLHRFNVATRKDEIIASNIGRSLHNIPKTNGMSFVHKVSENEWLIKKINTNGSIELITRALPGREDLTWTPDGKILMSDGKSLFYNIPGTKEWHPVEMPFTFSGTITRLAVNAKGNKLAVVISE